MKIGLVRHFKVNQPFPKKTFLSKSEVIEWFSQYNSTTTIEYKQVDLSDIDWQYCYSSPMLRAVSTARHIYKDQIMEIPSLKELDILHLLPNRLKLPFLLWGLIVRIQSFLPNKDTKKFKNEIIAFIDNVLTTNKGNILIVSHWFVMRVIRKALIKKGFTGENFKSNEYGTLYVLKLKKSNEE